MSSSSSASSSHALRRVAGRGAPSSIGIVAAPGVELVFLGAVTGLLACRGRGNLGRVRRSARPAVLSGAGALLLSLLARVRSDVSEPTAGRCELGCSAISGGRADRHVSADGVKPVPRATRLDPAREHHPAAVEPIPVATVLDPATRAHARRKPTMTMICHRHRRLPPRMLCAGWRVGARPRRSG